MEMTPEPWPRVPVTHVRPVSRTRALTFGWILGTVLLGAAPGICATSGRAPIAWAGGRWEPFGFQDASCSVVSFCTLGTVVYAGTSYGLFWRDMEPSRDKGWVAPSPQISLPSGCFPKAIVRDAFSTGTLYLGVSPHRTTLGWASKEVPGGTYCLKSVDAGATWSPSSSGIEGQYIYTMTAMSGTPGTLLLGTAEGILYKSFDGGRSWPFRQDRHTVFSEPVLSVVSHPTSSSVAMMGLPSGLGYAQEARSEDGGMTWRAVSLPLVWLSVYGEVESIALDPRDARVSYCSTGVSTVYKTLVTEDTIYWWAPSAPVSNVDTVAVHPGDSQCIVASGGGSAPSSLALAYSLDAGTSWTAVGVPADAHLGLCVTVDPANANAALVGTLGTGIWRVTFDGTPSYCLYAESDYGGTVARMPNEVLFAHGTTVTLTAQPGPHADFVRWEGDVGPTTATGRSAANPLVLTMDRTRVVRARFGLQKYAVTATAGPSGTVVRTPDQARYDWGSVVTLTARPHFSYRFTQWTGDVPPGRSRENPLILTVDTTRTLTGQFGLDASNWLIVH